MTNNDLFIPISSFFLDTCENVLKMSLRYLTLLNTLQQSIYEPKDGQIILFVLRMLLSQPKI